jgi:hypothetical protein
LPLVACWNCWSVRLTTVAEEPNALGARRPLASGDSCGPDADDDTDDDTDGDTDDDTDDEPDAVVPEPPLPAQPVTRVAAAAPTRRPRGRRRERMFLPSTM